MSSPLEYDAKVVKEFNITDDIDLGPELKLAHARQQRDEIMKFLWRERVELQLGEVQAKSDNELIADKGRAQITEKRNNIRQVTESLRLLNQLVDELEKTLAD